MTPRLRRAVATLGLGIAAALASGCASQAYDPVPARDAPVETRRFAVPLDVERSYRLLHRRLEACVTTGYHVLPRYRHSPQQAWITVVHGLGLDRYAFLLNQFEARFQVDPAPGGAQVTVSYLGEEMAVLARAAEGWLLNNDTGCSG